MFILLSVIYLTSCLTIIVILLVLKIYGINGRYGFEDKGAKKFATAKFMSFQIVEEKSVSSQIEDFQKLVSDLAKEGNVLLERFVAHGLVFKLPDS